MDLDQEKDEDSIDNHEIQLQRISKSLSDVRKSSVYEIRGSININGERRSSKLPPIPSATDLRNSMDESEDRLRQQQAIERTRLASIEVDQMLKGEEMIKEKQRGISTFIVRRQSIFPFALSTTALKNRPQKDRSSGSTLIRNRLLSLVPINEFGNSKYLKFKDLMLSSFETAIFVDVLQKFINELGILRFVIPVEINESWNLDSYQTIEEKYGTPEARVIFRKEMNLPPLVLTDMEKLQRDRTYSHKILEKILSEMKYDGKCEQLQTEMANISRMAQLEQILQLNHRIYQNQVKTLSEIIEENKENQKNERINLLELEEQTRNQIDDCKRKTACTLEYTERLEKANVKEVKLAWLTEEQKLMEDLKQYMKMVDIEQRVSEETCNHIQMKQKDFENDVHMWTDKHSEEFEQSNQKIDRLKESIELQKIALQDLQALEEIRQNYIDECLLEEEKLAEEAYYWQEVHRAAIIIQSLWKGYMVRHQLGSFQGLWTRLKKRKKKSKRKKTKAQKKSTK